MSSELGLPTTNIRRILSPTDLSEASAHATELSGIVAGWYGAHVTGLFVLSPLALALPSTMHVAQPTGVSAGDERAEASELERLRLETANRFETATRAGVGLDVLVEVGHPVSRILEWSQRLPADLIVMGTHGSGGFEHAILGSVAEKVLRKARCPVLTVAPRARSTSSPPFKRILCALDDSVASRSALDVALSLSVKARSSLTLVHVLEWPWEEPPAPRFDELPPAQRDALAEYRRYRENRASSWLDSLVPTWLPDSSMVSVRLAHGRPHEQLLRIAADEQSDVIVVGVGRRSALNMALFGSTAHHLVQAAACPVLTVRG